jgi:hypothetical protein
MLHFHFHMCVGKKPIKFNLPLIDLYTRKILTCGSENSKTTKYKFLIGKIFNNFVNHLKN